MTRLEADADGHGGAVRLLPGDVGDVDDELLAVASGDLALPGLVHSAGDEDLVVLADGHGADPVAGLQLLGEVRGHERPAGLGVGAEVCLARLTPTGRDGCGVLHVCVYYKCWKIGGSDGEERERVRSTMIQNHVK